MILWTLSMLLGFGGAYLLTQLWGPGWWSAWTILFGIMIPSVGKIACENWQETEGKPTLDRLNEVAKVILIGLATIVGLGILIWLYNATGMWQLDLR